MHGAAGHHAIWRGPVSPNCQRYPGPAFAVAGFKAAARTTAVGAEVNAQPALPGACCQQAQASPGGASRWLQPLSMQETLPCPGVQARSADVRQVPFFLFAAMRTGSQAGNGREPSVYGCDCPLACRKEDGAYDGV